MPMTEQTRLWRAINYPRGGTLGYARWASPEPREPYLLETLTVEDIVRRIELVRQEVDRQWRFERWLAREQRRSA